MARRHVRGRTAPKRRTKWCGAVSNANVRSLGALVVADAIPLCSPTTAVVDMPDPTAGWCRGSISISRLVTSDITPTLAWAIVLGRTNPGGTTPLQIFNPFDEGDLERQDILGMGYIKCSPILLEAADTLVPNNDSEVVHVNIRVGRKLMRNTNNLFLWLVADAANNAFQGQASIRTLMKF